MKMKKLMILFLLTVLTFSSMTTAFAKSSGPIEDNKVNQTTEYTVDDILSLEPYVEVDNGLFKLNAKKANIDGIDKGLIKGQLEFFDFLNKQVKLNVIKVSEDLTIQNLVEPKNVSDIGSVGIMATCYGKTSSPDYHWWGYKSYLNSCDTKKAISEINTAGASGAISTDGLAGAAIFFPVLAIPASVAAISSGWFWLFATRLDANNNGKGVIVEMTWAAVFDVAPQY